jgi:predicted Rossmann-fold nucleotide-binding protein
LGVLDEFCEMALWTQLGYHQKPCGLLNVNKYFDHLIAHLELAAKEGFIKQTHNKVVQDDADLEKLLAKMRAWAPSD